MGVPCARFQLLVSPASGPAAALAATSGIVLYKALPMFATTASSRVTLAQLFQRLQESHLLKP